MEIENSVLREPPIQELREGAVKAAVWRRSGRNGVYYQASFARLFRDATTGEWRESGSFGERDLENLAKVAAQAYGWITVNAPAV